MGPKLAALHVLLLTLFVNSHQSSYAAQTTECPPYYNGSIARGSCNQEYSICVNGVRQDATCTEGYVFHETDCVPREESSECEAYDDDSIEDEPSVDFDCSSQPDGPHAVGCANTFVKCVSGHAYTMYCPGSLVYNAHYDECRETCDVTEEIGEDDEEETTTTAPYTTEADDDEGEVYEEEVSTEAPTTVGYGEEEPEPVEFDCSGLEDGIYADGCSPFFYMCSNGFPFKQFCPAGTVYNPHQKACENDCNVPETTTTSTTTTTEAYETTTTVGFEEPSTTAPEYTTTELDEPSSTEVEYTTTPQDDVASTTESTTTSETTPGFEEPSTTSQAPIIVCNEGQVTTFGACSSRFNRCQNNSVRSKQCPVDTLFESALLMCVYDLPQCQPVTVPVVGTMYPTSYNNNNNYNQVFFPPSDTVVSPFDENVRLKPRFDRRRGHHRGPVYVDNPFFIPSHGGPYHRRTHHREERRHYGPHIESPFSTRFHGRALLNDGFKDFRRVRMDKLQYGDDRKVTGNKRFLIDDVFDGPKARYISSNIKTVFPMRGNRRLGPRADPDAFEDGSGFAPKDLFGATRRKRSAYYGGQQTGYGQQTTTTQVSDRQKQVDQDCKSFTTATYLTFGDCFNQFIYCSGNGVNRMAACPIGESFDKNIRACSETCGTSTPVVTATVSTETQTDAANDDVTSSTVHAGTGNDDENTYTETENDAGSTYTTSNYNTYPTTAPGNDQPSTTKAPVGDRCSQVASGLFSIGCSQKYIQCSHGSAIVRSCPGSLYFDESIDACNFRDQVPECQGYDSTSTYTPIVTLPAQDPSTGYQYTTGPSQEQPSTRYAYRTTQGPSNDQSSTYGYTSAPSQDMSSTTAGYGYPYRPSQDSTTSGYGYPTGPSQDSSSTTSGYGYTEGPSDDQPTTEVPYNPTAPQRDACFGLKNGAHGEACSSSYIVCSYGRRVSSINCALGEGFDPSVQYCRSFNQIPTQACNPQETTTDAGLAQPLPYVPLEDVLTTTTVQATSTTAVAEDEPVYEVTTAAYEMPTDAPAEDSTAVSTDAPVEDSTTIVVTDSYQRVAEDEDEEVYEEEQGCTPGSRLATGFCVKTYLECINNKYVEKMCRFGKQFDTTANKCVLRVACGQETIRKAVQDVISATSTTVSPKKIDGRCAHIDGEAVFALGKCSSNYVRCTYGAAKLEYCSGNKVFSNARLECVSKDSFADCITAQRLPVKSYNEHQDAFCDGKPDGLYRNKRDCSAILQCFGGELFEHSSCPSNLAFNELTAKCDYPQQVSGCENHNLSVGECAEHGAFIADVNSCSTFYRCVWGRKVTQKCPSGTVFNPALSVCDWPSAVPSCRGPADDDNNTGGYTTTNQAPYGTNYGF